VVVDDAPEMLRTISVVLADAPGVEVVAASSTAAAALEDAARLHPDLVLLDIRLPGCGGVSLVDQLRRCLPDCRIIALTVHEGRELEITRGESSVDAVLPKSQAFRNLPRLIEQLFPVRTPTP
jgi:DNA-binding NarL/FixJ family response regulator